MVKNTFYAAVAFSVLASAAHAAVVLKAEDAKSQLSVGGSITVAAPSVNQSGVFKNLAASSNRLFDNSSSLYSNKLAASGNLVFDISATPDEENQYGVYSKLNANTSLTASGKPDHTDKSMLYIDNKRFGRVEIGSYDGAYKKIKVSPADLAAGTGGIDGDFSDYFSYGAFYRSNVGAAPDNDYRYYDLSNSFYDSINLPGSGAKRANKVTYYTPSYNGFSGGISFIPDTEHQGTIFGPASAQVRKKGMGYTNVVELAAKYEGKVQDVGYAFSLVGNLGKAKTAQYVVDAIEAGTNTEVVNIERNNLQAIEAGFKVDCYGFSLAGSYGYLGKSGSPKGQVMQSVNGSSDVNVDTILTGTASTSFYSAGAAYTYDKFSTSVTYYKSSALGLMSVYDRGTQSASLTAATAIDVDGNKNKFDALSFGINYNIFDNLAVFGEYTHFKYSKKSGNKIQVVPADNPEDNKVSLNKGHVILVGLKAKF